MENVLVRVPGKLYIAGEYAILTKARSAILVAVDRYLELDIQTSSEGVFESDKGFLVFDLDLHFVGDDLSLVKQAITYAYKFIDYHKVERKLVSIKALSELNHKDGRKYGLGSSAAIMAGILKGLILIHGLEIDNLELFKLVSLAQKEISALSSGGDIASIINGGYIFYQRYDVEWFLNTDLSIQSIYEPWPKLKIEPIKVDLHQLIVGWTGVSQSSETFIEQFNTFTANNPLYTLLYANKSYMYIRKLKEALMKRDTKNIYKYIVKVQNLLEKLTKKTGIPIVSKAFVDMIKIGKKYKTPIKVSGAGFGDCGIGILPLNKTSTKTLIQNEWNEIGITPIELKVSKGGIHAIKKER